MTDKQLHTNLTDQEILQLHRKASDNRWLGVLLQRYTKLLLGVAIKYLKDKEQAADCVQQVFLKALTSLPEGEIQNFKGWLYILTRNQCFQLLKDNRYDLSDEAFYNKEAEAEPDVEALKRKDWTLDQIKNAVEELEEAQQVCIKMFYLEKRTYQQIMQEHGYTFKQVKSYVQNGKRNLKKIMIAKLNNIEK